MRYVIGGMIEEVRRRLFDQRKLERCGPRRSRPGRRGRADPDAVGGEPAITDQELQAEEQGIAGKGRECGVGRAAITGGAERQDLPQSLLGRVEKVHKGVCGRTEVSDAAVGR